MWECLNSLNLLGTRFQDGPQCSLRLWYSYPCIDSFPHCTRVGLCDQQTMAEGMRYHFWVSGIKDCSFYLGFTLSLALVEAISCMGSPWRCPQAKEPKPPANCLVSESGSRSQLQWNLQTQSQPRARLQPHEIPGPRTTKNQLLPNFRMSGTVLGNTFVVSSGYIL